MEKATREIVGTVLGVLALGGFALLVGHVLGRAAKAEELEWTRLVYLLSGVEAIAFAAAGYFFGRVVNRERAEGAEKRASEAQVDASEAQAKMTEAKQKEAVMKAGMESVRAAIRGRKQALGTGFGHFQSLNAQQLLQTEEMDLNALEAMVDDLLASART